MRICSPWLAALAIMLALPLQAAAQQDPVAYQPDIVAVERVFMVMLRVPPAAPEVGVKCPDSVVLLDKTPLPTTSEVRNFYFRAIQPAARAQIAFAHPQGEIIVPVEIWSFQDLRQFRELKGVQLPRRWPVEEPLPELKRSQTLTTEAVKRAYEGRSAPGARWLDISDQDIWSLQPDTSAAGRYYHPGVSAGCPVHGTEIYKDKSLYSWIIDTSLPYRWKIKCPVGGEEYPSNDFANDDFTGGDFVDDGLRGACEYQGKTYGFLGAIAQAYSSVMQSVAPQCAESYLATGDIRYVHKALVAFCRIAVEHAYLATMTHHRTMRTSAASIHQQLAQPLNFSDGPFWTRQSCLILMAGQADGQVRYAEAYDRIWPAIDQDTEIIPFLQGKGFDVKTHDDVRRFIEENLFGVWVQATLDGAIMTNGLGDPRAVARIAEMYNYQRGSELLHWVYYGGGGYGNRAAMRTFVPNIYFRDGAPPEATGGYNNWYVRALGPLVESIEHLRRLRPETYPEDIYPDFTKSRRYRSIFDFPMNTVNIGRSYPQIGDDNGVNPFPRYRVLSRRIWHSADIRAFEHAYHVFKDPKFAWALVNTPNWHPSIEFPYTRQQVEQDAARCPDDWNDASRLEDGFGVAMLRGGSGDERRALWMQYGRSRGHTQDDIMQIGLDADKSQILGNMGYPTRWSWWDTSWITKNAARQYPETYLTATAQLFADAGPVHLAEARAQGSSSSVGERGYTLQPDNWQRRMLALVDVSDEHFYCLDFYRIHGGTKHWWAFHAQEGDFTTSGLSLQKQEGGTLAGPQVPYGDEEWLKANGCRFRGGSGRVGWTGFLYPLVHLYNLARDTTGMGDTLRGPWFADWALKDADGLHFRLTVPEAEDTEVIVCDGQLPEGASPYQMKWILLQNEGEEPVKTQVLSLMELYRQQPVIRSVRPLPVSGEEEADLAPYGVQVELADATDTIFASADGETARSAEGGFEFAGRFGLYRERDGVPTDIVLVGGSRLVRNGFGVTAATAEYRAPIVAVNRETSSVIVSPPPPNPAALVGRYVHITNPVRRITSKVLEVKSDAESAELALEYDSCIGVGHVTGSAEQQVLTDTAFRLQGGRYYHGARVANAARTAEYQLAGITSGRFALIDPQLHPEATAEKLAAEFPQDSWFTVYDYGIGDEVVLPGVVVVRRVAPGAYKVASWNRPTVSLPAAATVEYVVE